MQQPGFAPPADGIPKPNHRVIEPEKLRSLVAEQQIYLFAGNALITSDPEDSYMSLYNADEDLLKLVQALAASVGLFVWKPSSDPETSEAGESGL